MSEVILYTTDDGATKIDLRFEDGTVWLSQLELAELFQTSKQNISKHIKAIFDDQELSESATVNQKLTVQNEGEYVVKSTFDLYLTVWQTVRVSCMLRPPRIHYAAGRRRPAHHHENTAVRNAHLTNC